MMTDAQIAKYEAKGFKRWTKGNMDRLYINVTDLGLVADYYKSGNVCGGEWQGEGVGSSATKRLLASKVYVDVKTGELHVTSNFDEYGMPSVEEVARKVVEDIEKGEDEPEEDATEEVASDKPATKLYKTETIASWGVECKRKNVWIDDEEFPNLYVEDGGEFIKINEDTVDLFDVVENDHYAFVITEADEVGYVDLDQSRGYIADGRVFEHLSDAMSAARRPQSARNKADAAYRKANVKQISVKLYPADADISEHLEGLEEPTATYIKRLIREDMARRA